MHGTRGVSLYDTDMADLRELKSWQHDQLNLAHGIETKKLEKTKNKKTSSSEETIQAIVCEGSPWGTIETKP